MSRLHFAVARGARVEAFHQGKWWLSQTIGTVGNEILLNERRIFAPDAHLQYGPVSAALRKAAEQPKILHQEMPSLPPYFAFSVEHETESEWRSLIASDELTHSLFLLILAEPIADEGM